MTRNKRPGGQLSTSRPEARASILWELAAVMMPLIAALVVNDLIGSDRTDLPGEVAVVQGPLPFLGLVVSLGLLWYFSVRRGATWADFGIQRPQSWTRTVLTALGVSLGVLAAVVVVINPAINALGVPERDMSRFEILQDDLPNLFINLLVMWITAGFIEELLFRGYLLKRLVDLQASTSRLAWLLALVGSSVIFALPHIDQGLEGMIRTGAIGFVFGVAFLAVGRKLWPVVLAHGFIDTIDFISHFFESTPS